jgi:hypothetical protein
LGEIEQLHEKMEGPSLQPRKDLLQPEFFFDSAEQIAQSIDGNGLRSNLDKAFQEAISRVKRNA